LTLIGGEWLTSDSVRCISGQIAPGKLWTSVWVGPRFGLNVLVKRNPLTLWGTTPRFLGSPLPQTHLHTQANACDCTVPLVIHKINFFQRTPVVYFAL